MDRGTSIQEKSHSVAAKMGADVADIRSKVDIATLNLFQKSGFTAGTGRETRPGEMLQSAGATKSSDLLRQSMSSSTNMTKDQFSGTFADVMQNNNLIDTAGQNAVTALKGLKNSFKILPLSIKGVTDGLMEAISSGDLDKTQEQNARLNETISKLKATTTSDNTGALNEITKLEGIKNQVDEVVTSGATVGAAANRVAGRSTTMPEGSVAGTSTNPAAPKEFTFTHHITGFCLKCKQEIESGHQAKGVAPQAQ
jgi:hypothetical protein